MRYLLDLKTSPPVVVAQVRDGGTGVAEALATAQRYADQTQHVLVWVDGPDSVTDPGHADVVHPIGHAPAPPAPQLPLAGVNLAPKVDLAPKVAPAHLGSLSADFGGLWSWLKGEAKSLEGPAEELAKKILNELLAKLFQ